MNQPIVLTVISPDQPGIIQSVSRVLKNHGGNWTQSSMSTLAGQFAGILLASVPQKNTRACLDELHDLESQGLKVTATISEHTESDETTHQYSLDLTGNDQPGIVHTITSLLADHHVNVSELSTDVESGSMSGGTIFRARATLHIPDSIDAGDLQADIEDLANDLMVDISFEK